ncbi:aspartate--ammonia ligase [Chitinophaga sp. HK235]|uniref:aspartate--ammonia ligase n=1 Tax=Chitinophaga sp. HK235 TaxID=2952571 RepID=UPI001BA4441E|nr:aspartate--ammonia ligase [Chitinophaga sp. HK235]
MITLTTKNDVLHLEKGIALIKEFFPVQLGRLLSLTKVSAPLFVKSGTGFNDDLNGVEKPVKFNLKDIPYPVEIVQSLAKWKRMRLHQLGMEAGQGIVTDMRAIRPDEVVSPIHSFYVDQWDWEKHIQASDRRISYLKDTVEKIYQAILDTNALLQEQHESVLELPASVYFIDSETLLKRYPGLTPKERENRIAKEYGAVFIMGIGGPLSDQAVHDDRAPDYDDWSTANEEGFFGLNGDLILWNPAMDSALELSSMGIRVDAASLKEQLSLKDCVHRSELEFHTNVLNSVYPLSIGGGIGQSRLCMFLLQRKHISEVQSGIWPESK